MKALRTALAALTVATLWFACSSTPPPADPFRSPCETEEDCISPLNTLCGERACVNGLCELEIYIQPRSDYRGDCKTEMCNRDGFAITVVDLDDVGDDGNPCTKDSCKETTGSAVTSHKPLEAGPVPNGSGFCDGRGHVLECLEEEDCADPLLTCSMFNACVPLACANGVLDEDLGESNIDCGGQCDTCANGQPCNVNMDCFSGICGDDKTCALPTCDDGVKNGFETDVDCGGESCDPCSDGSGCKGDNDCVNRSCFAGQCQKRTCDDGIRNGDEEETDCGGDCPPCQY